ncbi:MAG: hypothetical protein A2X23_05370 [Chloroflexi bacterium GWC2_73_18]|nr:MAG: hypothetical protein A2X23_05370 [Chloroflexi bacterium GWC2_73_18]
MALIVLFWIPVAILTWVYLVYPIVAAAAARLAPMRLRDEGPDPTVSVAIAVHDGAAQIADRIANAFAQEASGARVVEVIVGSDGSTDGTDAIVGDLARTERRLRLHSLPRAGQTPTQHVLFEAGRGEIVVLTDAETRFAPGCVAALARAFRDPRVSCATGHLVWAGQDATPTSHSEGVYWRYELRVRELESRAGWLTAVTGALVAVRRSSYRPVPARSSMDELLPLYIREEGGLVVYVADAVAHDRPISSLREQFRTRCRIAARGIVANISMLPRLPPWRYPGVVTAIVSHKLLRWATPWLVLVAAIGGGLLALAGSPLYAVAPVGLGVTLVCAGLAHVLMLRAGSAPRALAFARAFVVVNLAFAVGWINVLLGRRIERWQPATAGRKDQPIADHGGAARPG